MSNTLSIIYPLQKPPECERCPYNSTGMGFVPGWNPPNARMAVLAEAPVENDKSDREPLASGAGKIFMRLLNNAGLTKADVLIDTVLRCQGPNNSYPTGDFRHSAEAFCRRWDNTSGKNHIDGKQLVAGGLLDFAPNHFLFTIHPAALLKSWNLLRVLQEDVYKAKRLCDSGKRVLICLGEKSKDLIFPGQFAGGILRWRGHHGHLDWSEFKGRNRA
jgi:uracil-DNA glycosylase